MARRRRARDADGGAAFGAAGDVQKAEFDFDLIGNLTARRDKRFSITFSETFGYDTLNRLQLRAELRAGDAREPSAWWDGRRFQALVDGLRKGGQFNAVFSTVYGDSPARLTEGWVRKAATSSPSSR